VVVVAPLHRRSRLGRITGAHGFFIDSFVNRTARPVRSSRDLELEEPKTDVNGA
jgi:hypothetical protein